MVGVRLFDLQCHVAPLLQDFLEVRLLSDHFVVHWHVGRNLSGLSGLI